MSKWEKVKLGKYALIAAGQSAPQGESCYSQEGRPFIKAGNLYGLTNGTKEDDILKVNEDIAKKYKLKMFPKDTIVFAKSGMSCLKGYIYLIQDDCYVVNHLACVLPNIKYLYPSYIKYFFIYSPVNKLIKDEAYPSIRLTDIGEIKIPLPPLDIQKKIATALDSANARIEKRKEQIEKLDLLIKSQFIEMFGDPVTNPKGWETDVLGRLSDIYRGGSPRPISQFLGGNIPWIKIGDATKGDNIFLYETREKIIEDGVVKSRFVKDGSIIFANCGVSLGFARIIQFDGCIHDGWLSFENISPKLNKIFLLKSINMCTDFFREIAPDGTQPNLNTAIMKKYIQILPPSLLQNQFAEFVEKIEAQKVLLKKSLADMEQNYQSLMQKCFKGEIF